MRLRNLRIEIDRIELEIRCSMNKYKHDYAVSIERIILAVALSEEMVSFIRFNRLRCSDVLRKNILS